MDLSQVAGVVMDMDGVLWRGDVPLPGLVEFFDLLRARALPYVLATNNSSKTQADYIAKLARMNVHDVAEVQIITSGTATVYYMQGHYPAATPVHILGGAGLKQVMREAGYTLTDDGAKVVVVGIDFDLTYEKLKRASSLIRAGADFIGTNPDVTFPMPDGDAPGAGAILSALQTSTDCEPLVIGKPFLPMFDTALRILGTSAGQTLMIGDRLQTDILGAQQAGLKTALVLTGITTPEELSTSDIQPDIVYPGLPELTAAF